MSRRRLPPKADRRDLLRERGWKRGGYGGAEMWLHERYGRSHFSLAIAYRVEAGLVTNDEFLRGLREVERR